MNKRSRRNRKAEEPLLPSIPPVRSGLPEVKIYTDGGCNPNPGPGAWAALLVFVSPSTGEIVEKEIFGYCPATTNNRMEMMAAIMALETLNRECHAMIWSDSILLVKGAREWLEKWKANGWRKGSVKNRDLWERLDATQARHHVKWHWVKGHNGHRENERVDELCTQAIMAGDA
jgi:ribonuclease HI